MRDFLVHSPRNEKQISMKPSFFAISTIPDVLHACNKYVCYRGHVCLSLCWLFNDSVSIEAKYHRREINYWTWNSWWNVNSEGKLKYPEKICPSVILATTNPTWPDLRLNPTTSNLSYCTTWLSWGNSANFEWIFAKFHVIKLYQHSSTFSNFIHNQRTANSLNRRESL
jgi:hypothetical protein